MDYDEDTLLLALLLKRKLVRKRELKITEFDNILQYNASVKVV